ELPCGCAGRQAQPHRTAGACKRCRARTISHRSHDHSNRRTQHSAGAFGFLQLPFRRMGHAVTYLIALIFLLAPQNPALDSPSPKERQAAIEKMAVPGNHDAVQQLTAALKKEPKSDVRAEIVAALGRIRDRSAVPTLADTLKTDLDKNVRSQAID